MTTRLSEHEAVIERGLGTFVEVGRALAAIRDQRLYKADYPSFEAYCDQRWNLSRSRAYDLIGAASTVAALSAIADTPAPVNEGQARELRGLPPETAATVMREAAEATNGNPTATAIKDARAHITETTRTSQTTKTEYAVDTTTGEISEPKSPRTSSPRIDVVREINKTLYHAGQAAQFAEQIRREHLRNRSEEATVWVGRLSRSLEQLQRLHDALQEASQ